jgi:porphobilinogen synthase
MLRSLIRETEVTLKHMVLPLFIRHGQNIKSPINSMPGHFQISIDMLPFEIEAIQKLGIQSILLFGIPESKDSHGKDSYSEDGIIQQALRIIKKQAPEMLVISDVCFCEYTDHGHCGILTANHEVDNDSTLQYLVMQAISHAKGRCRYHCSKRHDGWCSGSDSTRFG